MILGKTHPCFDYHKFFFTKYPEAFKQMYGLRDFMNYRTVEWHNKDPSDPIERMELESKAEENQATFTQEQRERPVNEQQGNFFKVQMDVLSSFENQAPATEVEMDRIQIELFIPENNRKRNLHESEDESEEEENGLFGRIRKQVKSAFTK